MSHARFFFGSIPITFLAASMTAFTVGSFLVAAAGFANRPAPSFAGAIRRAINLPVIARGADAVLLVTEGAGEDPVAYLIRWHALPAWTKQGDSGHTGERISEFRVATSD